jgi:hypothetical protein
MLLTFFTTNGKTVESRLVSSTTLSDEAYSMSGGQRVLLFAEPDVVAEHQMLADVATLRVNELTVDPVATMRHLLTKKIVLCSIDLSNTFEISELAIMWQQLSGSNHYAIAKRTTVIDL